MIKKILSALVSISLIFTFTIVSFADSDMSVTALLDASTGEVTLSGYADSTVSVTVTQSDVTFEDYMTELDKCIFFGFVNPEDGELEKTFTVPSSAPGGKYIVYITNDSGDAKTSFMKPGTVSDDVLLSINTAADGGAIKEIAEANSDSLGVDTEHLRYDEVSAYAYDIIFSAQKEYASATNFYEDYLKAYAISLIALGEDGKEELKQNAVHLGINFTNDFENDKRLDDGKKAETINLIQEKDWVTGMSPSDDIGEVFKEEFIILKAIASVRMCDTRVQLQSVIEKDFDEEFSFVKENSKFNKIKNEDKVFEEMVKSSKDAKTLKDVESIFESAVSKVYKSENSQASGGGGGGGGGGGYVYEEKPTVGISSSYGEDANVKDEHLEENKGFEFSDVSKDYWGYSAINALIEKKMINGYEDGSFRPEGLITRAEFARLMVNLYEASGKIASNDGEAFEDVEAHVWYYDAINKASGLGIIKGADGKFNPQSVITRQDAALILYRTLVLLGTQVEGEASFKDFDAISSYAKDAVSALAGSGFISGMGDDSFAPLSNLTRAQAAQIIYNVVK